MPKPEEVFTPRAATVNTEMYVPRDRHETSLQNALRRNTHILIHGESGTGKSWLYKKVFADLGVFYVVANLANASRLGTIGRELQNLIDRYEKARKTGCEKAKGAEIGPVFGKGKLEHKGQYTIPTKEPFESCLAFLRRNAGRRIAVLVLDNLESAFTSKHLKELADMIILCDDERYAEYEVKMLIVGVPKGLREYYYTTPNLATVGNRLCEIPEVARLGVAQCYALVKKGFSLIGIQVSELNRITKHIMWVTDRIPQRIHEYCLELAFLAERSGGRIDETDLLIADLYWLQQSLYEVYAVIEGHMNDRDTRVGRRNQTLYSLAQITSDEFKAPRVEELLRAEFPRSTSGTKLNVPQMLSQLAGGKTPLIRRTPKGDAYEFCDLRHRMAMRTMLLKTADERVERVSLPTVSTTIPR